MIKNIDPNAIILDAEIFNKLLKAAEKYVPKNILSFPILTEHVRKFNIDVKNKHRDANLLRQEKFKDSIKRTKDFISENQGKTVYFDNRVSGKQSLGFLIAVKVIGKSKYKDHVLIEPFPKESPFVVSIRKEDLKGWRTEQHIDKLHPLIKINFDEFDIVPDPGWVDTYRFKNRENTLTPDVFNK